MAAMTTAKAIRMVASSQPRPPADEPLSDGLGNGLFSMSESAGAAQRPAAMKQQSRVESIIKLRRFTVGSQKGPTFDEQDLRGRLIGSSGQLGSAVVGNLEQIDQLLLSSLDVGKAHRSEKIRMIVDGLAAFVGQSGQAAMS